MSAWVSPVLGGAWYGRLGQDMGTELDWPEIGTFGSRSGLVGVSKLSFKAD